MDDIAVKAAVERFVKNISFAAQREVEKAVRRAMAEGKARGGEVFTTSVTLSNEKLDLDVTIFNKIEL